MKGSRIVVVVLVAGLVAAMALGFDGRPSATSAGLEAPPIPSAGQPGALSSTWYCAAANAAAEAPLQHDLYLVNPAGEVVTATLSAYNEAGHIGTSDVEVAASGSTRVDVNATFGGPGLSVMAESPSAELLVEHRISGEQLADQVPCATNSSDRWYFPAQTSLSNTSIRTAAQLYLFNPFAEDASVDVSAALPDSINAPQELQGIVVPARSARVLDLSTAAARRDQFAVAVETRRGQIVAETSQFQTSGGTDEIPATRGVRLTLGVSTPASDLAFAEGFTGTGVGERLVVYNPGAETARVLVQVTPYGASDLPPEPFELEVPSRRYSELDLSAETRIPGEGLHAMRVQTDPDTPVVAGRVVTVFDAAPAPSTEGIVGRPGLTRGLADGTATPVAATLWAMTGVDVGPQRSATVAVFNPGAGTVRFSATVLGGPQDGTVLADAVEVAPGDSVAVDSSSVEFDDAAVTVQVEATGPVVVERTLAWSDVNDLSMGLAIPTPRDGAQLVELGER